MPRAPTFIAPKFSGSGSVGRPTSRTGDLAVGQGLSSLGGDLFDVAVNLARKQTAVRANKKIAKFKEASAERAIEARQAASPGAEGFTPKFMEGFDQDVQGLLDSSESNSERRLLETSLDRLRAFTFASALEFEAISGVVQRKLDLQNSIDSTANAIRSNPEQFTDGLEDTLGTLDAIRDDLTPADEGQLKEKIEQTLAVAAIQGEIDLSPGLAFERLESGVWDQYITPQQKNTLLSKARSSASTVDKVAIAQWKKRVEDNLASLQATGTGVPGVNFEGATAVYGPTPERDVVMLNLERAEKLALGVYEINGQITTGTAQEKRDVVDDLAGKVLAGGEGSADNQVLLNFAAASYTRLQKALEDDSAGVALEHSPAVQSAVDRGTIQGIEASIEEQVRIGIPRDNVRILTNAQVAPLVKELSSGNVPDDIQRIAGLRQEWGPEFFGKAMSELVDGGLDPLIPWIDTIALNDPAAGVKVLRILRTSLADAKAQFAPLALYTDLESAVQDITVPMLEALAGNSIGRLEYVRKMQQLMVRWAAASAVQDGFEDVNKSAKDAYDVLFGNHYLLQESYYIPARDDEGAPYDTDRIIDWTSDILRNQVSISKLGVDPSAIELADGIPVAVPHKLTDLLASKNGAWINTADGKGLQLIFQTSLGPGIVRFQDTGELVIFSLREIEGFGFEIKEERIKATQRVSSQRALEEIKQGFAILEKRRKEQREIIERVAREP